MAYSRISSYYIFLIPPNQSSITKAYSVRSGQETLQQLALYRPSGIEAIASRYALAMWWTDVCRIVIRILTSTLPQLQILWWDGLSQRTWSQDVGSRLCLTSMLSSLRFTHIKIYRIKNLILLPKQWHCFSSRLTPHNITSLWTVWVWCQSWSNVDMEDIASWLTS